jgi:hypothetical protein
MISAQCQIIPLKAYYRGNGNHSTLDVRFSFPEAKVEIKTAIHRDIIIRLKKEGSSLTGLAFCGTLNIATEMCASLAKCTDMKKCFQRSTPLYSGC